MTDQAHEGSGDNAATHVDGARLDFSLNPHADAAVILARVRAGYAERVGQPSDSPWPAILNAERQRRAESLGLPSDATWTDILDRRGQLVTTQHAVRMGIIQPGQQITADELAWHLGKRTRITAAKYRPQRLVRKISYAVLSKTRTHRSFL